MKRKLVEDMHMKWRMERWENQSLLFGISEAKQLLILVFSFCNFKLCFVQNILKVFVVFSQIIKF